MATVESAEVRVVPANEASWDDLQAVFGERGYPSQCQCQRIRLGDHDWWDMPVEERAALLHEQTSCGDPDAPATSGLVAYVDGEPAGWVAVAPRTEYRRYRNSSVPWAGRHEDKGDDSVWTIACFVVRAGFRGRGLTYDLARAAVEHARSRGAEAVEGYPIVAPPGKEITWGETNVGTPGPFAAAGLEEVSSPTVRRRVTRLDF
ncbi:GNAT family N-acetyltransferase [Antribacter sp. KLBMP9083]|uniref:GNAT family N-acetyltransferase n=1 Tax=Antribacter soli TaxID=2910976 RepID=A0AA41QF14_9MICO|nr:GNAT family N-acetyltransferase [Antribacter soli]MCF4121610.1 GNAT family N-acetyltransferase [Antribacter soli]